MTSTGPDRALIMVVDDDRDLRESLCELLELEGFRAVGCADGAVALDRLKSAAESPSLILLDLMMPRVNGWQFRQLQLQDADLAEIPVVVMTAGRDVQDITAHAIVWKPLQFDTFFDVVKRHAASPDSAAS